MKLIYLDQNALIKLGFKSKSLLVRQKVDRAISSHSVSFVVSYWHLIETAHTISLGNAIALANFMDSLRPSWLLERRNIQQLEVEEDFFAFAKIGFEIAPRVTTRVQAIALLNRQRPSAKHDIPSHRFVEQWIRHPEQLEPLEKPYKKNAQNLPRLRELAKAGKFTPEVKRTVDRKLFESTFPSLTRAGLEIGNSLRLEYLAQATVSSIPSFAIENAIFEHELSVRGGADRNTLIDKFHLIAALPYVDEIVSDDKFFSRLHPVAQNTGYVKAQLLKFEDFLKRL